MGPRGIKKVKNRNNSKGRQCGLAGSQFRKSNAGVLLICTGQQARSKFGTMSSSRTEGLEVKWAEKCSSFATSAEKGKVCDLTCMSHFVGPRLATLLVQYVEANTSPLLRSCSTVFYSV